MKQADKKEFLQLIYAVLFGLVAEAVYYVVIEYTSYFMPNNFLGLGVFLGYIIAVGIVVAVFISRYCKKHDSLAGCFAPLVALLGGVYLHLMILDHYYVIYYHLYGRFYPISDDFGDIVFMAFLGLVYIVWIPEALFFIVRKVIRIIINK